jgi:glucan phosphoethanolaminetransferase (alkaline phosphatase superfamily)
MNYKTEMLLVAIAAGCFGGMIGTLVSAPWVGAVSALPIYFIIRTWMRAYSERFVTNAIATIAFSILILGAVGSVAFQAYAVDKMSPQAHADYVFAISHPTGMK